MRGIRSQPDCNACGAGGRLFTMLLKGADWSAVSFEVMILASFILLSMALAPMRFRRTPD
jgi:hypothetical protein